MKIHSTSTSNNRRRVLLYGKSLILGTIAASLKQYRAIEIIPSASSLPTLMELGTLAPDVIVFDVQAAHPEFAVTLLAMRPQLVLIGIDPSSDQMLLWSGQQTRALTMQDLVGAIMHQQPDPQSLTTRAWADAKSLSQFVSQQVKFTPTYRQKLAFAIAVVIVGVGLFLMQATVAPNTNVSLVGTAAGNAGGLTGWMLVGSILIVGLLTAVWMRWNKKR